MKRIEKPQLQSLEDFCEEQKDCVTMGQMRGYIARAKKNGAHMWIRRMGRRIYIDVDKFFEWTNRKI